METTKYTRTQLNTPFLSIAEQKTFIGKIKGNFQTKYSKTWESNFITVDMETVTGDVVSTVLDGGLRGALKMAGVIDGTVTMNDAKEIEENTLRVIKPDMLVEIEFAEKIEVANGKANSYNVYALN